MEIISIAISISLVISVLSIIHVLSKKIDNIEKEVSINFDLLYYIANQNDRRMLLRLYDAQITFTEKEMYSKLEYIRGTNKENHKTNR
jgi:hypothetical protein|uniref:Uncharacterized protein n=1 Tax=Podoviridae sp. ctDwO1 TaxID=2827726 RepID=A0A8S5TA96_9CAUD|nr:MAG TPA: hypothetical protein [Podoviridae sp. ctDwO1]